MIKRLSVKMGDDNDTIFSYLSVGSDWKFQKSLTVQSLEVSILFNPSKMSVSTRETYRISK